MSYKTTIVDIARELNTTPATVSRALSNHPGISEKTKRSYIYLIKKFVEYPLFNNLPYKFELSKLAFRLSRIIYNNISKSEGVRLFLYSQNRLGYSRIVSSIWLIHIILSHPGVPLIFRKIANVIPKFFLKANLTFNSRTHLTASSLS